MSDDMKPTIDKPTIGLRSNFAIHHLQAGARAARDAYEIEKANENADYGPWIHEMIRLVPVSIVMAGAALEANANELIQDILDKSTNLSLSRGRELLLKDFKEDRSGNAINKYRQIALLFDKEPDVEKSAWKDGQLLVKFRNSFMHFKPAWDHEDIHSGTLVKDLKKKVPVVRSWQGKFLFPYPFMTYGCAKWSVQSVLAFSREFSALLGIKDRFAGAVLTLPSSG